MDHAVRLLVRRMAEFAYAPESSLEPLTLANLPTVR